MNSIDRLVTRALAATTLPAIDTVLEPTATLQRRAEPLPDSEITRERIAGCESHIRDLVAVYRKWLVWFLPVLACEVGLLGLLSVYEEWVLLPDMIAQGATYGSFVALDTSLTNAVMAVTWILVAVWALWGLAAGVTMQALPEGRSLIALAVALKRRVVGEAAMGILREAPADSYLRRFFGTLVREAPEPRD